MRRLYEDEMDRSPPRLSNFMNITKATVTKTDYKFDEDTIDRILGTPAKVVIPERYIPEQRPELTPEEVRKRRQKADNICRMLSGTCISPRPSVAADRDDSSPAGASSASDSSGSASSSSWSSSGSASGSCNSLLPLSPSVRPKVVDERRQREHLLQLNQILARQVTERSRVVAAHAAAKRDFDSPSPDDDLSPVTPLPTLQKRDNWLT